MQAMQCLAISPTTIDAKDYLQLVAISQEDVEKWC